MNPASSLDRDRPFDANALLLALVADQLVVREETSRGPEYRAPFDDPRFKSLIMFFRQESVIVTALQRALKPFKSIEYACIFGSFASGTTHISPAFCR